MNNIQSDQVVTLSWEQCRALEIMEGGRNVFLSGNAGTGKSVTIKEFRRRSTKNIVSLAPSGIAAQTLGGVTIHSFFKFELGVLKPDAPISLSPEQAALYRSIEVIILDEVGCCRSDLFQRIDKVMRHAAVERKKMLPFGGAQILALGDFAQIGPVTVDSELKTYLRKELGGVYAFNTPAWKQARMYNIELRQIHRQANKNDIAILNAIRTGNYIEECEIPMDEERWIKGAPQCYATMVKNYLDELNEKCYKPDAEVDPNVISLCTTKRLAAKINQEAIDAIDAPAVRFTAKIIGHFPEDRYPTNKNLTVKVNMRIILLSNKYSADGSLIYSNGSTAVVTGIISGKKPKIAVELSSGLIEEIEPYVWENYSFELVTDAFGKTDIEQKAVGWMITYPLLPGYSITAHKAQSLSLEAIRICAESPFFANGQLYSSLSRCRSLDRVTLSRRLNDEDVKVSKEVMDFLGIEQVNMHA